MLAIQIGAGLCLGAFIIAVVISYKELRDEVHQLSRMSNKHIERYYELNSKIKDLEEKVK